MKIYREVSSKYFYLFLAFIIGLIPAVSFIHMFAKDFVGYYILSESFVQHGAYAFVQVVGYGTDQIGLQARAPLLPFLLSISTFFFGNTLLGIYFPILISRLLVTPLAFLVSRYFLPVEIAFLASSMTVFFPKLQTFSLSAFEADSFVLVFYLFALLFYLQYKKTFKKFNLILCGLFLGLLSLVKELGLPISLGFLAAFVFEWFLNVSFKNKCRIRNFTSIALPFLLLVVPFFLYTLTKAGSLYFSAVTVDRSVKYLPGNLPFLLETIPLYIGLEEWSLPILNIKSFLVNFAVLVLLLVGFFHLFLKKNLSLIFPILFTIFALGIVNSASLGGKIPGNFELITIMAFAMPIVSIFIFKGLLVVIDFFGHKIIFLKQHLKFIYLLFCLVLMFKLVNNFFSKPATLDFAGEYYINLSTVINNKKQLPRYSFEKDEEGNWMVKDLLALNSFMRNEYMQERVGVFSYHFKLSIVSAVLAGIGFSFVNYLFDPKNRFVFTKKLHKRSRRVRST